MTIGGKELILVDFPQNQYVREAQEKKQIVLHHTVSGPGALGDINWWRETKSRIATCLIIARNGVPYQCFGSQYWGWHLGANNTNLERHSIGVELDSWGGLQMHKGKFYRSVWANGRFTPDFNTEIAAERVVVYQEAYRGFYAYERYTDAQLKTLRELLKLWNKKYGIPLRYQPGMWDRNQEALRGVPGVWSHTSYRADKSDVHPQFELINMLKSL